MIRPARQDAASSSAIPSWPHRSNEFLISDLSGLAAGAPTFREVIAAGFIEKHGSALLAHGPGSSGNRRSLRLL
jgi:hypothetical protein